MDKPDIRLKRAYQPASAEDGIRLLVDRLWPRGISKQTLQAAAWIKEIAPSTELRQWFGHRPERAEEFRVRYTQELAANPDAVAEIRRWIGQGRVTLLYGARDTRLNSATVLRDYLLRTQAHAPPRD